MSDIFTLAFATSVLAAAIMYGTPLLFAALGELLTERSGTLNLGVEGMMIVGALAGFAVTAWTGNCWVGAIGAMVAGGLMASIHAVLTVGLQANQVVSGLALTIFGTGLAAFLGRNYAGQQAASQFSRLDLGPLTDLPYLGPILFNQNALAYIAMALAPALWFFIYRTRWGLELRATGERPEAADAMGVPVYRLRVTYIIIGGVLAGLGGAAISLGTNPGWTEGLTAGRGWIAVALVIFAGWNPMRAMFGAYLFGGIEGLNFRLQATSVHIDPIFLSMLPYLFTILVLVLASREGTRRRLGAPASLGKPYVRGERE